MTARPGSPGGGPSFALALGGGGARGLAHIVVLEAGCGSLSKGKTHPLRGADVVVSGALRSKLP